MIYENGSLIHKHFEYNGVSTNNHSEYKAILIALEWCAANTDPTKTSLELHSDNELVVRQLNGEYKMKSASLKPLNEKIRKLAAKFKSAEFRNVRRENIYIKAVDRALNVLLDKMASTS